MKREKTRFRKQHCRLRSCPTSAVPAAGCSIPLPLRPAPSRLSRWLPPTSDSRQSQLFPPVLSPVSCPGPSSLFCCGRKTWWRNLPGLRQRGRGTSRPLPRRRRLGFWKAEDSRSVCFHLPPPLPANLLMTSYHKMDPPSFKVFTAPTGPACAP